MTRWLALAAVLTLGCGGKTDPQPTAPEAADAADAGMSPAQPGLLTEEEFKALHVLAEGQAPTLLGTDVEVAGARGYLSLPAGEAPHPGVVVIHEWWGLNDNIRHWADRLAADGYAALAVDLYGGTVATNADEAMAAMKAVDDARALEILGAAHAFLAEDPRVQAERRGVVGWCFGGGWSLRHALTVDDLDAAVMYYGRLVTDPEQLAGLDAPLLGIFGTKDQGIPVASVEAFEAALKAQGKSVEIHLYEADHAFANPSNAHYDETSASQAWDEVRTFFAQHLREG